jgi:pimeloyl-ACP methyl ester carboxylesterase
VSPLSQAAEDWRARGRLVRARGLEVFVVDAPGPAAAPPLLLLHGFPTSSLDFHSVLPALATRRRVVTLDYPGFGYSAKPADYSYSLIEQADVVECVLRELGVARAHVVAHDMGTSVATELLARRAAGLLHFEVDRVVLMNGSVHAEMAHLTTSQKLLRLPRVGPLFARVANRALYGRQLRATLGRRQALSEAELDDQFALIRRESGHLRLPAIMGYYDERRRFARRWIGALEALDRPALILWGARDPVAVSAIAEQLAHETPGARLQWLDELGHYPQLEDPERVVRELESFFGGAP